MTDSPRRIQSTPPEQREREGRKKKDDSWIGNAKSRFISFSMYLVIYNTQNKKCRKNVGENVKFRSSFLNA